MNVNPLHENVQNVIEWADARNIYHPTDGGTMTSQLFKLVEEIGEAVSGVVKRKKHEIKDGIGDTKVCLINVMEIARRNGMDNLTEISEKEKSLLQLISSIGFMAEAILNGDVDNNISGIADAIDWDLDNLAKAEGFTFDECLQQAYDDIKDRKGMMINRCFVKESDLHIGKSLNVITSDEVPAISEKDHTLLVTKKEGVYSKPAIVTDDITSIESQMCESDVKLTPEEKSAELDAFAYILGYGNLFKEAKQAIALLEAQKTMPLEVFDFIENQKNAYEILSDEGKQEFVEENRILSFDEWFFANYENGKEIKANYEDLMKIVHELTEEQQEIIGSGGNESEILSNPRFVEISEKLEALDKEVSEKYGDTIVESSMKYTQYKTDKINNSINKQ